MSRRTLLTVVPAVAAVGALAAIQRHEHAVIDVRSYGATGDGMTDDSLAIQSAVAELRPGRTLHFPRGTYRFAQHWPSGTAAIAIAGVSDATVEFAPGAELVMDNLDPHDGTGTSHGVLLRGPSSRVSLRNITVRWAHPAKRSLGDGIRVEGLPGDGRTLPTGWRGFPSPVDGLAVIDCTVVSSPQAGVVLHGVSDVRVERLHVDGTGADGLHLNACRRASVAGLRAVKPGDDGLAFVTYFGPEFSFDPDAHTFAFPTLTDWSNADVEVRDVEVVGGSANGVRVAGAQRLTIDALDVVGVVAGSAVMLDSAEPGADVGWNYLASRAIRIDEFTATACDTGVHVLARPHAPGAGGFTDFDVQIGRAALVSCSNWAVRAESLAEAKMTGLSIEDCTIASTSTTAGNGGVGIDNARGVTMGTVAIQHSDAVVGFAAKDSDRMEIEHLSITIDRTQPPPDGAPPCVALDGVEGVIADLAVDWPSAPAAWIAVRQSAAEQCGGQGASVAITTLKGVTKEQVSACP